MRLFIAVDLPEKVKDQLTALQDPKLDVRWTSTDTMHLTLRFVGEVVEESVRNRLIEELSATQFPPFSMTIKGLGYFPPRKRPKIIWAGLKKNKTLMSLQGKIENICQTVGFEPENRSYIPHITIGRVQGLPREEVNSFFDRHKNLKIEDISVNEFILYKSELHPDGAKHIPLERFELTRK